MRYTLGEKLRFDANFRGRTFLRGGWSTPEKNHCWSVGDQANMELNIGFAPQTDLILKIECSPFLGSANLEHQTVDLFVNNDFIGSRHVASLALFEFKIPRKLAFGGNLNLTFQIRTPISPSDLGLSADTRRLGINLRTVMLFPELLKIPLNSRSVSGGEDPLGNVYNVDGSFHRFVRTEDCALLRRLRDTGVYQRMTDAGLLPDHYFREISDPSFSYVVSAVSGRTVPASFFPTLMLKDAAKIWIRANLELLDHSGDDEVLGLLDGHGGNFIQMENSKPVWCDIGSISNVESRIRGGYTQFLRSFIYPLAMLSAGDIKPSKIRALMQENAEGITRQQMLELSPNSAGLIDGIEDEYQPSMRRQSLEKLWVMVEELDFIKKKSFWADYRDPGALKHVWTTDFLANQKDQRYVAVHSLIRRSRATDFIDLGCNDGLFSLLCLREGMRGTAIDLDENAVNKLYTFMRGEPGPELAIACCNFADRFCSADLTMALALVHHLVLCQGFTLAACAKQLALYTNRALITEFMLDGLGGIQNHKAPYPNPLPLDYSLANFIAALSQHFRLVEVIDYDRDATLANFSRRVLIYCESPIGLLVAQNSAS
jgi:hypothetical protein